MHWAPVPPSSVESQVRSVRCIRVETCRPRVFLHSLENRLRGCCTVGVVTVVTVCSSPRKAMTGGAAWL